MSYIYSLDIETSHRPLSVSALRRLKRDEPGADLYYDTSDVVIGRWHYLTDVLEPRLEALLREQYPSLAWQF